MAEQKFKSGFVSLIGRPSSGKSTLVNAICGFNVSIVANKPQTTRFAIRGIYTEEEAQIIFIDTPGYHQHNAILNKNLSNLAVKTLGDGDLILYLLDVTREFGDEEQAIVEIVKHHQERLIVVCNKIDEAPDFETTSTNFNEVKSQLTNCLYLAVSALEENGLRRLVDAIIDSLPEGPLYYPEEFVTDQSIPFRIEEVVRESIFSFTEEEIPHAVYVKVEDCEVSERKIIAHATVYVEKNSQKGIVVGKAGSVIKNIGSEARKKLETIFERKVNLFLQVKVHENWKKDEKFIKKMFNQ